jgi:hypothetical protein
MEEFRNIDLKTVRHYVRDEMQSVADLVSEENLETVTPLVEDSSSPNYHVTPIKGVNQAINLIIRSVQSN